MRAPVATADSSATEQQDSSGRRLGQQAPRAARRRRAARMRAVSSGKLTGTRAPSQATVRAEPGEQQRRRRWRCRGRSCGRSRSAAARSRLPSLRTSPAVPLTAPSITLRSTSGHGVGRGPTGPADEGGVAPRRRTRRAPARRARRPSGGAPLVHEVAEHDADGRAPAMATTANAHLVAVDSVVWARLLARTTGSSHCSRNWVLWLKGRLRSPPSDGQAGQHHQRDHISDGDSWGCSVVVLAVGVGHGRPSARRPRRSSACSASARRVGVLPAGLAEEHHDHLAGHVVGGEQRGDQARRPTAPGSCPRRRAGSRPSTRSRRTAARRRWPASRR